MAPSYPADVMESSVRWRPKHAWQRKACGAVNACVADAVRWFRAPLPMP